MRYLVWGLALVPVSFVVRFLFPATPALFVLSALAIVPLAGLMGLATEELAILAGPRWGGFLNATFGNAAELIIAFFAITAGELEVVKASITGAFIGNILLILGLSFLVAGYKRKEPTFSMAGVSVHTTMLVIGVTGLYVPSIFTQAVPEVSGIAIESLSLSVATILIGVYIAGLVFTFITHRSLFPPPPEDGATGDHHFGRAMLILGAATAFIAVESEFLVSSIGPVIETYGMNELFIGVVIVAFVGNAAEHSSAVWMAWKGRLEVSLEIATGSSIQIALFVAPVLVFLSLALGEPLTLVFNVFELVAVGFSVAVLNFIARDGRTNWLEGLQLLAAYLILALAFFFIP